MKCSNCDKDAIYKIDRTNAKSIYLCARDLPKHMREDAALGKFAMPKAPVKKSKAVEEPEVVEPVVVEDPAETSDENL